jgi:hypothetical protein
MQTETTPSGTFRIEPDGVLVGTLTVREHTLAQARENVAHIDGVLRAAGPHPMLLDVREVRELETAAARHYANPGQSLRPAATALVVKGALNRILGNLALAVMELAGNKMPLRLFEDLEAARAWARGFAPARTPRPS